MTDETTRKLLALLFRMIGDARIDVMALRGCVEGGTIHLEQLPRVRTSIAAQIEPFISPLEEALLSSEPGPNFEAQMQAMLRAFQGPVQ